ncbi:poly [ADP-ribose] polymerase 1-like [Rhincodon typus]|uniref:poly [ADP-ribose] polymerase 1-like n=1 Tax=Rhincodon typus TaxID=259920 RepID=UPI002030B301|nr:poly [ADP-ribose] polymerase 1-like [Rhincodon typus]XP_048450312.1 poly [ADP-ribose] polymerase 1-like [Rhincodon typus]
MKVLILGKLSKKKDELKTLVEEFGGKITSTASKAKLCISSQKEVDKMSKKMEEVKEANVRVVSEDLLDDLQSGKGLQELLSVHGISSWGAELAPEKVSEPPVAGKSTGSKVTKNSSGKIKQEQESSKSEKKMKLTVKGGAAVDPDSGLEDSAHVFEQGGRILSATLGLVDISRSQNSYYKLQLLEDDNKKRFTAPRVKGVSGIKGTGPRVEGVVLVFGGGGQGVSPRVKGADPVMALSYAEGALRQGWARAGGAGVIGIVSCWASESSLIGFTVKDSPLYQC